MRLIPARGDVTTGPNRGPLRRGAGAGPRSGSSDDSEGCHTVGRVVPTTRRVATPWGSHATHGGSQGRTRSDAPAARTGGLAAAGSPLGFPSGRSSAVGRLRRPGPKTAKTATGFRERKAGGVGRPLALSAHPKTPARLKLRCFCLPLMGSSAAAACGRDSEAHRVPIPRASRSGPAPHHAQHESSRAAGGSAATRATERWVASSAPRR